MSDACPWPLFAGINRGGEHHQLCMVGPPASNRSGSCRRDSPRCGRPAQWTAGSLSFGPYVGLGPMTFHDIGPCVLLVPTGHPRASVRSVRAMSTGADRTLRSAFARRDRCTRGA